MFSCQIKIDQMLKLSLQIESPMLVLWSTARRTVKCCSASASSVNPVFKVSSLLHRDLMFSALQWTFKSNASRTSMFLLPTSDFFFFFFGDSILCTHLNLHKTRWMEMLLERYYSCYLNPYSIPHSMVSIWNVLKIPIHITEVFQPPHAYFGAKCFIFCFWACIQNTSKTGKVHTWIHHGECDRSVPCWNLKWAVFIYKAWIMSAGGGWLWPSLLLCLFLCVGSSHPETALNPLARRHGDLHQSWVVSLIFLAVMRSLSPRPFIIL